MGCNARNTNKQTNKRNHEASNLAIIRRISIIIIISLQKNAFGQQWLHNICCSLKYPITKNSTNVYRLRNVNHLSIIKSGRTLRGSHLKTFSVPVFKINTRAVRSGKEEKRNGMFRWIQRASYSTPCLAYRDKLNTSNQFSLTRRRGQSCSWYVVLIFTLKTIDGKGPNWYYCTSVGMLILSAACELYKNKKQKHIHFSLRI